MGVEIERKFLVKKATWKRGSVDTIIEMMQWYICIDEHATVRVRISERSERTAVMQKSVFCKLDKVAYLTTKGKSSGISRAEFEYKIPVADAEHMLDMRVHGTRVIDKTRYCVYDEYGQHWEIDVFHGDLQGLVIAEIELPDESTHVRLPEWVGDEVSTDRRYTNAYLATKGV